MDIVVGYVPNPEGAALDRAIEEAMLRGARLVVVNASRGDAYVDSGYVPGQEIELLKSSCSRHRPEHPPRRPPPRARHEGRPRRSTRGRSVGDMTEGPYELFNKCTRRCGDHSNWPIEPTPPLYDDEANQ